MSLYIDRKYLLLNSARLRNFKQKKDDLFNFSCPFCGDSQTNHLKARGYISKAKKFNGYIFTCHNCNVSTNFDAFLRFLNAEGHKEYVMEKFREVNKRERVSLPPMKAPTPVATGIRPESVSLESIDKLAPDHYARVYVEKRLIPERFWKEIFFAPDYKKFLDETFPDHGKDKLSEDDPRLVLFFTNILGEITQVTGRSLTVADAKLRYITVRVSESRKVYGLHRLNPKDRVYVTEGQFDSMFLPNAVASGDSSLNKCAEWLFDTLGIDPVLVFDNEPRNKQIVKTISDSILMDDWTVCLLPSSFPGKDINEAILNGLTLPELNRIIESNTYSGLTAQLKLATWRKC
jgi:transcription elongation factor Elf1